MDKGIESEEMQWLLNFIRGKIFPYSKGISTYPDIKDGNQENIQNALEKLKSLGYFEIDKVHIYSVGPTLMRTFLWMPVE